MKRKRPAPATPPPRPPRAAARPWVLAAAPAWTLVACVAVAAAVAYWPILRNGFTYDDSSALPAGQRMALLLHPATYFGKQYFAASMEATYRPMVTLSYGIELPLWGSSPVGYHLTNLLLHALATALLVPVCFSMGASRRVALTAGLLYAVHPLRSEAVCSVGFREDLLCTMFYLAAFALWPSFVWQERARLALSPERERLARTRLALALFAFVLALLSKEMALSFPLLVLAKDLRGWRRASPCAKEFLKGRLPWHLAAASLTAGALVLFLTFHGENAGFINQDGVALGRRVAGFFWITVRYLGLFLWPHPLCADYVTKFQAPWLWPAGSASALALAAAGVACFRKRTAFPAAWHAFVAFLILLGPVSNLIRLDHPMAERYLTLPMAPLCYLAGHLFAGIRSPARRWGSLGLVLVVLTLTSWHRCQDWFSGQTLWTAEIKHNPSPLAHNNLGVLALSDNSKRPEDAIAFFQEALRLRPDYAEAFANLSRAYVAQRSLDLAEQSVRRAIALKPTLAMYHASLADILVFASRNEEAEAECRQALRYEQDDLLVCVTVAASRLRMRDLDGADEALRAATAADPAVSRMWPEIFGWVLARRERFAEALPFFENALRTKPNLPTALEGRGLTLEGLGRLDEAIRTYAQYVTTRPQSPRGYLWLGRVLLRAERRDEARRCLQDGLAVARQTGDGEAENEFRQALDGLM